MEAPIAWRLKNTVGNLSLNNICRFIGKSWLNPPMKRPHWAFIHPFQLRLQRGIEVYLWELASALAENGVDVDLLTWGGPLEIPTYVSPLVKLKIVPSVRYYQHWVAIPFYVWHLVKNQYDHIFVHFAGYGEGPALRLARRMKQIPFSVVIHFPPSLVPHRFQEYKKWGLSLNAKCLIAVSQATAREVEAWSGRACSVIGHGVDHQRFQPSGALRRQVRQKFEAQSDAPILISVAALEERKGIQWVIQALPKVLETKPATQYWIVGDGPYRGELEEHVRQLKLGNRVLFLGFQRDVAPYLAASDIALLLSHGEASPVSLLEFAAAGLPVITSFHPPFPELIEPDWGQMIQEQDTQELSQTIIELLASPALRLSRGNAGRAWAIEKHTWYQTTQQYKDLLDLRS